MFVNEALEMFYWAIQIQTHVVPASDTGQFPQSPAVSGAAPNQGQPDDPERPLDFNRWGISTTH